MAYNYNSSQQGNEFEQQGRVADNQAKDKSNNLNSQSQAAGFGALAGLETAVKRVSLPGLLIGAAQTAAFLAKLQPIQYNEPIPLYSSKLTTSYVFDRLELKRTEYGGNKLAIIELAECVMNVHHERIIVKTFLKGKDTSHKQFLQNGDYIISVVGRLTEKGHLYPIDKMKDLDYVLSSEVSLDCTCRFLNECFSIKRVVCEGRPKFFQIEGAENEYGFEFTLVGD